MNCKGCLTKNAMKEFEPKKCLIVSNAPNRNCPCQTCLVKSMCTSQCQEYIDLINSIHQIDISYDYKYIHKRDWGFDSNPMYKRSDIFQFWKGV